MRADIAGVHKAVWCNIYSADPMNFNRAKEAQEKAKVGCK
jgi:hypothetical protein